MRMGNAQFLRVMMFLTTIIAGYSCKFEEFSLYNLKLQPPIFVLFPIRFGDQFNPCTKEEYSQDAKVPYTAAD